VPGELREWGTVTADELTRVLVLSPHLDDAVLGCGQLLAAHPGATVLTVFAGAPDSYPDPMTWWDQLAGFESEHDPLDARRKEDARALGELRAQPLWLEFVEHQYLDRDDWVRPAAIVHELEAAIRRADPTMVVAPFGLANPDHDCTHEAALLVRERLPDPAWFCYEETGYKHVPGLLAWRVARLFRSGVWPTPAVMPVSSDAAAKQAALAHYSSQMRALEVDWQLSTKLAAPEQYWRLAPPPEGWERLAEIPAASQGR
jgi:LmbE family N-acetylglucosaminyl deacetylase